MLAPSTLELLCHKICKTQLASKQSSRLMDKIHNCRQVTQSRKTMQTSLLALGPPPGSMCCIALASNVPFGKLLPFPAHQILQL